MKKLLKLITLSVLIISFVFLLTGCDKKETSKKKEKKEESIKTVFEVQQVSDKSIKINLDNAKQGEEKEAKLVVTDGEDLRTQTALDGAAGITVYYYKAGSDRDEEADSEYLNGEGESLSEDFPAGEYEVVIEVTDEDVTGTVEINVEK